MLYTVYAKGTDILLNLLKLSILCCSCLFISVSLQSLHKQVPPAFSDSERTNFRGAFEHTAIASFGVLVTLKLWSAVTSLSLGDKTKELRIYRCENM